jgi:hypothetical protein
METKKLINRETMSNATLKRILQHNRVRNIFELVALAQSEGARLGRSEVDKQVKATQYYIDKYNDQILEARDAKKQKELIAKKKEKEAKKKEKEKEKEMKKIKKNVIVDVLERQPLDEEAFIEFGYKMSEKCKKLIGKKTAYLQFTCQNPEKYKWSSNKYSPYYAEISDDEIDWLNTIRDDGIDVMFNIDQKNGGSIWWENICKKHLSFTDSQSINALRFMNFRLVIMIADEIPAKRIQQSFRDGLVDHCVIDKLVELWTKYAENAESKASKVRCFQIANKIKKLREKYEKGVPEDDMEEVAKVAKRCVIIHTIISNEIKRYNTKSTQYFHFTNTRKNHVDVGYITMDKQYENVTQEQINAIVKKSDWGLFGGMYENPNSYRCIEGAYAVYNKEYELFNEFSKEVGINNYAINAVKNKQLNTFLKEGRIINSTPISLNELPKDMKDIKHADLSKAYTQHKLCKFYQGFLGKIHHFVKGDFSIDFIKKNVGMYQFLVIQIENENLQKLGIHTHQTYTLPSPEILYMISKGVQVKILGGAFGSTFDFEYTDEMLDNRNYTIWAGKLGMDTDHNTYTFKGDSEWASHLKYELGDDKVNYWSAKGLITIKVDKLSYTTKHHILAFITSYTRINMLNLMDSIDGKLYKVILDGIYYSGDIDDDFDIEYKNKEIRSHSYFGDGWYNPSEFNINELPEFDSRFDGNCVLAGAGGTGKSHSVFNYKGFNDVLYVVPTNELGFGSGKKFTTIHRLIGVECQSYRSMYNIPSVIFIDELTMMEKSWIEKAIAMYPESLILIGGDIDKKQWFQCRNGYPGHFSEIWMGNNWRFVYYENDYRSLDDKLKQFKTNIRTEMKRIFTDGNMLDTLKMKQYIMNNVDMISFDDAVLKHKEGDMWITGTHKTKDKLKVNKIECEFNDKKQHGFTVHSFQGMTISDRKVFITMDMFEYAMYYTAISRVRNFSQLVFVR